MQKFFFTLYLLLAFVCSFGQSLQGVILDSVRRQPLQGVDIILINLRDSALVGKQTDEMGRFIFPSVLQGNYLFKVEFLGYKTCSKNLTIQAENIDLKEILLTETETQSDSITIQGAVIAVVQKGDTTEYNAQAHTLQSDASAGDLVKKMGATIDQEGVKVQGENINKVLVDGKPFFDNNPKTALDNLPGKAVKKVQVYDEKNKMNPSETPTKTMNIVLRPEMREGVFGKATMGYGTDNRYIAGGNLNSFNGRRRLSFLAKTNNINEQGFGFEEIGEMMGASMSRQGNNITLQSVKWGANPFDFIGGGNTGISTNHSAGFHYNDILGKKWEVSSTYFFTANQNTVIETSNRQYLLGQKQLYEQNRTQNAQSFNHKASFRIEYKPDTLNSFELKPTVNFTHNQDNTLINSQSTVLSKKINATQNQTLNTGNNWTIGSGLYYSHRFPKTAHIFYMNVNGSLSQQQSTGNFYSTNTFYNDSTTIDTLNQQNHLLNASINFSSNLHYTHALNKTSFLAFDYANSYRKINSDRNVYQYNYKSLKYSNLDSSLTNQYLNEYQTHKATSAYNFNKEKKNLDIELAFQYSTLTGNQIFPQRAFAPRNFWAVLPAIRYRNQLKNKAHLNLSYYTATSAPNISQLQNVINNQNPLILTLGNPDLKQSYTHNIEARYRINNSEKNTFFQTTIRGDYQLNNIATQTYFAQNDTVIGEVFLIKKGVQIQQPINLSGYSGGQWNMGYGFPLTKLKLRVEIRLSEAFRHRPALFNGKLNHSYSNNIGSNMQISSNISEKIEFSYNLSPSYASVINSVNQNQNTSYISMGNSGSCVWTFWKQFFISTDFSHIYRKGLSTNFSPNYLLWSGSLGTKIGKKQAWRISLYAFDLLNQNRSIGRQPSDTYIEDSQTNVLGRYLMLKASYNFSKYKESEKGKEREGMRRGGENRKLH